MSSAGMLRGSVHSEADAPAFAAVRKLCWRHGRELFMASALLPVAKRDALCALYAFCRMLREAIKPPDSGDDGAAPPSTIGVSCCSTSSIDQTLKLFRDRLEDIYHHRTELPLSRYRDEAQHALHAITVTIGRYQISQSYFLELAEARRMELIIRRYATWTALERYCSRSGGAIGRMAACILGASHSDAGQHAEQWGSAVRFTAILRDLQKDMGEGRLYLPLEDLARFKVTQQALVAGEATSEFRELMRFEVARARRLYRAGAEGLCWLEGDGSRMTAAMVALMHSGILRAIERQGCDVFTRPAALSGVEKLRRVAPAWRLARRGSHEPVPAVFG